MSSAVMRASLLAGALLFVLFASSVIGWKFQHDPALGWRAYGMLYPPWAAIFWWQAWAHAAPYRAVFLNAQNLALVLVVLPFLGVRLWHMFGPMQLNQRPADAGLGSAKMLRRKAAVAASGPGVVLGRSGRFGPVLRDNGDGHLLIMGPARSGKGAGHVVPTLLLHPGSMLVVDPKRELYAITGRQRAKFGRVVVVDPTALNSARFNPLREIRLADDGMPMIGDCQMIAAMLAYSGNGPGGGKDETWDDAAFKLLTTMLYQVRASDDPTLAHLGRLALKITANGVVKPVDAFVDERFAAHRKLTERVRDSVSFTVNTRLAFIEDPMVQAVTGHSDFRPGDLQAEGQPPITLFLSVPSDQRRRLRPLTRLFLQSIWAPLTHDIAYLADGRPKRMTPQVKPEQVLALIDEFPQLGRMDVIEHGIADCAGFGLRVALVCQDIDQINAAYGTNQSITANCSTICAIPGFSGHGLDTMAKWAGKHAVAHASRQMGWRGTNSTSQSETQLAVLDARTMLQRTTEEVLVFAHGVPPTWLRKVRYFKDSVFRNLFDAPVTRRAEPVPEPATTDDPELPPWLMTHRS